MVGVGRKILERLLDRYDPQNSLYRWLLNFCYMTIDRFPDGVPAAIASIRHSSMRFMARAGTPRAPHIPICCSKIRRKSWASTPSTQARALPSRILMAMAGSIS